VSKKQEKLSQLQVQLEDLVRALSKNNQSVEFNNAKYPLS
jgi:hypothetical protein